MMIISGLLSAWSVLLLVLLHQHDHHADAAAFVPFLHRRQRFQQQPGFVVNSGGGNHSPFILRRRRREASATPSTFTMPLLSSPSSTSDSASSTTLPEGEPTLTLYNSRTRKKEPFEPVMMKEKKGDGSSNKVSMYTCGPTVYDYAHIGNFRAFLTYDLVKRVLSYLGFDVTHVCNLTDVDDKIINRANEMKIDDVKELTSKYEEEFMTDLKLLNVVPATHYPRATEHITEMMDMILELASKGLAYETSDGSWYFRTQEQPGYGKQLVDLNYDDMEQTDRGESEGKEHFADFCLWKAFKEGVDRSDSAWSSDKIKLGRPGWHMECSAMARKYFGDDTIDLHGGGIDLKFPHHENEIAQSQGVTGRTFCNCWFHNGFVNLDNEKMSKSLGNFLTLRTACPSALDIRAYRYLVVSSQYRNPLAFTPKAMQASKNSIKRIDKLKAAIEEALQSSGTSTPAEGVSSSKLAESVVPGILENFELAIRDDLSMPRAAASLFSLVKVGEKELKRSADDGGGGGAIDLVGLQSILDALRRMDQIFGIFYDVPLPEDGSSSKGDDDEIPTQVVELVSQRTAAKDAKDWELADSLRARIKELGFVVKDVKGGEAIISRMEA